MAPPSPAPHRPDDICTYLDGTKAFALLDAKEEQRQARGLQELRHAWWNVALTERELAPRLRALTRAQPASAASEVLEGWAAGRPATRDLVNQLIAADPYGCILEALEVGLAEDHGGPAHRLRQARARYIRARNRFMCANLRLVVTVAKRYGRHHMALADRVQEGNIGLLKAIERFDPERGFRFSTYAGWWIRHAVKRALVNHGRLVRIPAHIHTLFTKVRRARLALKAELGREPTLAEVAAQIDTPLRNVEAAVETMELRTVGLDEPYAAEDGWSIGEVLPDEEAYAWAQRIDDRLDGRRVDEAIHVLDAVAYDIVMHRFGLEGIELRTLRSLGERHHLSRERIRQLQNKALFGLRQAIEGHPIEGHPIEGHAVEPHASA